MPLALWGDDSHGRNQHPKVPKTIGPCRRTIVLKKSLAAINFDKRLSKKHQKMNSKKDSPGVYPPPPLFYVMVFFVSILLQHYIALSLKFFESPISHYVAPVFIGLGVISILPALISFVKSKNTLVTILPAKSLQTKGIYSISRNPMYVGLLFIYTGIACIKGNWWTFILIPAVIFTVNQLVIMKEEKYLERAFGPQYLDYKHKVRRWL